MDRTALLQRFDGRSRLLAHALYSGTEGARKAQIVFNKQRRCDPHFSLAPFLESLCQQEACLLEDELVLKPLACVFSDVFKRNLLCFLHLIHPGYPKDSVLHLLQCLSKEDGEKQWVSALITQLKRDIEGARKGTLLSSNCTETLKSLCGRFRDTDVKGGWTSCFEVLEAKGEETNMSVLSQKKRKSDKMDLDEDTQEDPQSKKVKMDFSSSKDEERMIEEEEAEIRRSEMDQSAGSVSQARSDLLGFSKNLPDHMKAALPVIKELLDAESELSPFFNPGSPQWNEPPTYTEHVLCSGCPSSHNPSLENIHTHLLTLIHYGQFSLPNSPVPHALDSRGNRNTRRKPTQTQGEHANSTQKRQLTQPRLEPATFLL